MKSKQRLKASGGFLNLLIADCQNLNLGITMKLKKKSNVSRALFVLILPVLLMLNEGCAYSKPLPPKAERLDYTKLTLVGDLPPIVSECPDIGNLIMRRFFEYGKWPYDGYNLHKFFEHADRFIIVQIRANETTQLNVTYVKED